MRTQRYQAFTPGRSLSRTKDTATSSIVTMMSTRRSSTPLSLAPDGELARIIRVIDAETIGPHGVIVSRAAARQLTSIHTWTLFSKTRWNWPDRFTSERVQNGAQVSPGMLLVGKKSMKVEQNSDATTWVATSLFCPNDVFGHVSIVEATNTSIGRVELRVQAACPLALGDLLVLGEEAGVVVAIEESQESFILWPGISGNLRVEKHASAELVAHARATGALLDVRESPPLGKALGGGQRLRASHIRLLREHGALFALHELLTVKSDDSGGRRTLLDCIARGVPECRAEVPTAILMLELVLHALGFVAPLRGEKIPLTLASDASICARSGGEVKLNNTLQSGPHFGTHHGMPDGSFDEVVFGSRHDSEARRTRFGHISLAAPVIHPLFLAEVMLLLGIDAKELQSVMNESRTFAGEVADHWRDTGTTALADALEAVDLDVLAEGRAHAVSSRDACVPRRFDPRRSSFGCGPSRRHAFVPSSKGTT